MLEFMFNVLIFVMKGATSDFLRIALTNEKKKKIKKRASISQIGPRFKLL